jgi:hypothetical protein
MGTLLIGYDLDKPGQDYSNLMAAIKGLGSWWHHLDSTWLVKSDLTTKAARDLLAKHIDDNDELLVISVTGREAAWTGFNEKGGQWIKDNL